MGRDLDSPFTTSDALDWAGSGPVISVFAAFPVGHGREPVFPDLSRFNGRVARYEMDDECGLLARGRVVEYDLCLSSLPPELRELVTACLAAAAEAGSVVAWSAFEGSFSFEHLLTSDIADQVYGVADAEGVAVDIDRASTAHSPRDAWRDRVVRAGARLRTELGRRD